MVSEEVFYCHGMETDIIYFMVWRLTVQWKFVGGAILTFAWFDFRVESNVEQNNFANAPTCVL